MNSASDLPSAIVLGLSATGLYAIRELGAVGIPVIGVGETRLAGAASRYLRGVIIEPDEQRRLQALREQAVNASRKPVLIPTSDQDLEFIIRNSADLAEHFVFQESYGDGLAASILDKALFYQLCEKSGVVYPALHEVSPRDLKALQDRLSFPVLIKPSRIHDIKAEMSGKKGWVAQNLEEFAKVCQIIPGHAGNLLVQEIVPGPESEITLFTAYFDGQGGVHQPFTCRKLRQFPPGFGSASLVISEDEPETREIAERMLCDIGFRGIAAAELKRDPVTGQRKMIEINPRPSLWFSASTASRKFVALAAYCDLTHAMAMPQERTQENGVLWRYPLKDSYSAMFYRLNRGFVLPPPNVDVASTAQKRVSPVSVPGDRAPARAELLNYLVKGLRRLWRQMLWLVTRGR